ncbi:golvesin C-terminal-like domain-containing protein [Catalinimonas niigatensis]|uniref:golvesin C-terminal-like domain-containing protein n=1 Tax=Catalinimonas niigatensis TaxID=1397264 RepID=UPI002666107B|nr:heparin lyase I family protein [Catalinimonas niigatensis]WPP48700.1 heparin lyase I family protein [Catalinimonas niigatensis]
MKFFTKLLIISSILLFFSCEEDFTLNSMQHFPLANSFNLGENSEIIIDNTDLGFSTTGSWTISTWQGGGYTRYGDDYYHDNNTGKGSKAATFTTSVTPGNYDVYAWWCASPNRATNTPFEIITSTGSETILINQREQGGEWILIGNYTFGSTANVIINNANTDGYVVADAIKLEATSNNNYRVQVNITSGTPTYNNTTWNHLNLAPSSGASLNNLQDTDGNATGINFKITSSGFIANNNGPQTGDDSGVVPDGVMKTYYYIENDEQTLELTGLNASDTYSFTFYGGSSYSGDRTAIYTIDNQSVSLNAALNTSQTVQISNVIPNSTGNIIIKMNKGLGASYGFLNSIIIDVNSSSGGDNSTNDLPSALPPLELLRGYEFEDNIGRNVNITQDGIKVHHLSREGGIVISTDGGSRGTVGAYHFKILNDGDTYSGSGEFYRQELEPRNLPAPYFTNGRQAKWGQEYVYQLRRKMTENYQIGNEYVGFMGGKNDYFSSRSGTSLKTEGDHYRYEMNFDTESGGTGNGQEDGPYVPWRRQYFASDGEVLEPGVDFNSNTFMGSGYEKISNDIGKWVVWTWHVKWSYESDGFLRIYKDNQLFMSYDGPNTFKDIVDRAPYFKFGIYNNYWKNPNNNTGSSIQEAYVDYFRVYVPE